VLRVTDTVIIAEKGFGIMLYVARSNKTPKPLIKYSLDLLRNARILGLIMNSIEMHKVSSLYYTYQYPNYAYYSNAYAYGYDYYYGYPWTGIDFSPYDIVIIGMDGGLAEAADIQKLRTDVIDAGKTLIFLGGTCYQPFAIAMNDYIVQNDINNYCWQITGSPNWTLVDSSHPLADGLPDSYNYANMSAGYYSIRVTDPDAEVVGINGESWPTFFRKATDGNFIWYIDSVYSSYWADPNDFAFLKQVIQNSIEATGGGDALWLSENPMVGTVPIDGGTAVIDVTFDAGVVTQPGTYLAELKIKTNDPVNNKFVVPVTMNVNGPPDWGRVEGIVSSLGYCDGNPVPVEGATVQVVGGPTLVTDANGHYSTWLQQGTYDIIVMADGHVNGYATVIILPQQTTYQDFGLRWIGPCISVAPPVFEVTVPQGATLEETLSIINSGAGDTPFKVNEAFGQQAGAPARALGTGKVNTAIGVSAPSSTLAAPVPSANPAAVLWDQPLSSVNQNAYVNQDFTDYPTYSSFLADDFVNDEPWDISTIFVPGNGWNGFSSLMNAESLTWQVYADNGGIPGGDPFSGGAVWSLTLPPTDPQVVITNGSGGMPSNATLNLSVPVTIEDGHWWFVFYPTGPFSGFGQYGRQPADTANGYWTQFKNPGGGFGYGTDWQPWSAIGADRQDSAFRIEGEIGSQDVPWLSEDPTLGTVPADTTVDVAVTFDSTGLAIGDYTAALKVKTADAGHPTITIPVTMHVVGGGLPIHVSDITGRFAMDPYGRYLLKMKVGVHNADHTTLGEVAVTASMWSPDGGPFVRTRMTKPTTGHASFHWGSAFAGTWQICVEDLVKTGYYYNPADNDVPECAQWANTP
jgi:hypothetical protein